MSTDDNDLSYNENTMCDIIKSYHKMAIDFSNHPEMMKDKTLIQFLAYSLDSDDQEVIECALKTLELLLQNISNHNSLKSTFGIMEALSATSERHDLDESLINLTQAIYRELQFPQPSCKSKGTATGPMDYNKRKFCSKDTRNILENTLVRIRGVISVVVDVEHQRCTIRVIDKVTLDFIINTIAEKTTLKARLIVRNKLNQEVLAATEDDAISKEEYGLPQYLPEEESPVKEKALHPFDRFKAGATGLINTATSFFQNSFFW